MAMPEPERHIRHNRHAGPRLGRGALDGRAPFAPPELEISISGLGIALLPHTGPWRFHHTYDQSGRKGRDIPPKLYAAARGERVCADTQRRLSYALRELNDEPQGPNRIAHVAFGRNGPQLRFGLGPVKVQGR